MAKLTLTYGTLPDHCDLRDMFDSAGRVVAPCGIPTLAVALRGTDSATYARAEARASYDQYDEFFPGGPVGEWTANETTQVVSALVALWGDGDEEAGSLASSLLSLVGVEWI